MRLVIGIVHVTMRLVIEIVCHCETIVEIRDYIVLVADLIGFVFFIIIVGDRGTPDNKRSYLHLEHHFSLPFTCADTPIMQ